MARTFKKVYDQALVDILEFPEASPLIAVTKVEARRKNLGRFPYHIVYVIDPDAIYIYAVAQSHREPLYWLERLREPGRE